MRTNFEKCTKRDRVEKRHKQQLGNSQKREWNC